jgi:hypothetical protein
VQRREADQRRRGRVGGDRAQHGDRLLSPDRPQGVRGRRAHVGIRVGEPADERRRGARVADPGEDVHGELAHVGVGVLQRVDQARHGGGALVDQGLDRSVAAAGILSVGQRGDQGDGHAVGIRARRQALDTGLAHSPARISQAFDEPGNHFAGSQGLDALHRQTPHFLVQALEVAQHALAIALVEAAHQACSLESAMRSMARSR